MMCQTQCVFGSGAEMTEIKGVRGQTNFNRFGHTTITFEPWSDKSLRNFHHNICALTVAIRV